MDNIPFLWYQWIRYQRDYPPTHDEMREYDAYLTETQRKAAAIKQRDDAARLHNPDFYDEQKKQLEQVQKQLTDKAQREVIDLFRSRENALRIAAENKVARMQQADDIIQSERRQYEEMQFEKLQSAYADPSSVVPKEAQEPEEAGGKPEPFKPGAWRPWQDDVNEEEEQVESNARTQK